MALIRKFPLDPGLNFIGQRNIFLDIAALITVASVAITIVPGLNFGDDFRGGLLHEARLPQPPVLGELRIRLVALVLVVVTPHPYGQPTDWLHDFTNSSSDGPRGGTKLVS